MISLALALRKLFEREFSVRTRGDLSTPSEFAAIVVAERAGNIVRLGEVAEVEVGPEDDRTRARYNGRPSIGLGVVKQNKASTVQVATAVREALPDLRNQLQGGMRLDSAYDSSVFIQDSIDQVVQTIFIAMLLVFLVVLAFLKSFRATIVPALAIPISLVGAFAVIYFLGFTINILTLLALVLAVGLVVDDAIVMLENVFRHIEMGKSRRQAAFDGAKEIGFAIVATTVALVAVFVPVAFLTGNVGRLLNEFAASLAFAVIISSFVALSLSPMLCSRILKPLHGGSASWATRSFDAFFRWLEDTYERSLEAVVGRPALVIGAALIVVAGAAFVFTRLPRELVPTEDRGIAFGNADQMRKRIRS